MVFKIFNKENKKYLYNKNKLNNKNYLLNIIYSVTVSQKLNYRIITIINLIYMIY